MSAFSIVTISYNQAAFVEETILSVLNQKGVELEYMVLDAGSTDGSRDVIERYRDRCSSLIFECDNGPADGLNKAFQRATGEIYGYLNSDDTLEENALACVDDFMRSHPDVEVVFGHGNVIDSSGRRIRRLWSEPFSRLMVAYGAAIQIQPSTFVRKSAFLAAGGFNHDNRSNWDSELLVRLYLTGARFSILDANLSNYRLHESSITVKGSLDEEIAQWGRRRFELLMGRPYTTVDAVIGIFFRIWKHLIFPRAALERAIKGPLYKRDLG